MHFDDSCIDHRVFHVRLVGDGFEKPDGHVRRHPTAKPRVGRAPVAEDGRKIAPRAPGPHDPEDRLQKPPVVGAAPTWIAGLPTVKPVALVADAIQDVTRRGQLVLDTFLGSGTTLIAAERCGRRFRGLDIDPAYVDVAVDRWTAMTGGVPRLAGQSEP